jgi:predicted choloylglycine hydrolase
VRNYDLSPDLNEGLLLRSEWTGGPVMGMVEFLWGLSDGMNARGLVLALAYGGRAEVAQGFGVTTILRYVLETCGTVAQALAAFARIPSHMAYNIVLADRSGTAASVELQPGGGLTLRQPALATNHQGASCAADPTGSLARHQRLERLIADEIAPGALGKAFLEAPLFQSNHAGGFGTLFTAVYDPGALVLTLRWPHQDWRQSLEHFTEGRRAITYRPDPTGGYILEPVGFRDNGTDIATILEGLRPFLSPGQARRLETWCDRARSNGCPDWADLGAAFAGRNIVTPGS